MRVYMLHFQKITVFLFMTGCWEYDFQELVEEMSGLDFTVTAVDPVGYGRSRPPDRVFDKDYAKKDAQIFHSLMKVGSLRILKGY